jgi:hypothetical protein
LWWGRWDLNEALMAMASPILLISTQSLSFFFKGRLNLLKALSGDISRDPLFVQSKSIAQDF